MNMATLRMSLARSRKLRNERTHVHYSCTNRDSALLSRSPVDLIVHAHTLAGQPAAGGHARLPIDAHQHPLQVVVQGDKIEAERDEQEALGEVRHHHGADAQREGGVEDVIQRRLGGFEEVVARVGKCVAITLSHIITG